jgi:P-type Na+/K+ transporter
MQVINHDVFKHTGITWEWGIVFIETILFFLGAEAWKWAKRVYFRRVAARKGQSPQDLEKRAFGSFAEIGVWESEGSRETVVAGEIRGEIRGEKL